IEAYQAENPHVNITYRKLTFSEYEGAIVDALASGKGPDIWSIHNTWLPKHIDKLEPAPADLITLNDYQDTFVDVASKDFVDSEGQIYAIPMSVDTAALYYNKDLLNTAFVVEPPATWTDFKEAVKKLTATDESGEIIRSGVSMGTAYNVNRSPDILSLLMLQNGAQMVNDAKTAATFNQSATTSDGESYFPGLEALIFYTDFSNPRKSVYTWTPTMPNSIDAFVAEESAMMFSYAYQQEVLKEKSPKLNFGVATMPQIENTPKEVNYANYWGEVVSKSSEHKEEAWKFLTFLAKKNVSEKYVELTGRPAARKDIVKDQLEDPKLRIFAGQALTADSWYQKDPSAVDNIFSKMIESVVLGESEPEDALNSANQKITTQMQ
ncbi:extracellular solute-binding protein, partial [Patescibacteria group bacterium]|nr:extracellular solute-binding protein [Patescibacteria group bacterium]